MDAWFYYNTADGSTQWNHPLDDVYRDKVVEARKLAVETGKTVFERIQLNKENDTLHKTMLLCIDLTCYVSGKTQEDVEKESPSDKEEIKEKKTDEEGEIEEPASANKIGEQYKLEENKESPKKQYLNPLGRIVLEADDNTEVSGATNEYLESDKSNMPLVNLHT